IAKHRAARQPCWRTVEEPVAVPATVEAHTGESDFILIDCLTLWLNNLLLELREEPFAAMASKTSGEAQALITAARRGTVFAVTSEGGAGIGPEPLFARQFRDLQVLFDQQVARAAEKVYLHTCGI